MAETIAAISTALQRSGIAIIRVSGDEALTVCDKIFKGKKTLTESESHRILYGKVLDDGKVIDECLCSVMKAPNSYTKENVVEINVHGGILSAQKTLKALLKNGARPAKAGEFTLRAFMNGRMDLSSAEAVADIIDSKTSLAQTSAVNQLDGKLAKGINEIRARIIEVLSLISVSTDFPDEDADSLTGVDTLDEIKKVKKEIEKLLANADKGIILREGALCAICGKPNVGKSSLLNALSGKERAIVTEIEGTTRDIIEEYLNIGDIPVRLADTAGIRHNADEVEKIGVEKALEYIKGADLCVFVVDGNREFDERDAEIFEYVKEKPYIVVLNKSELPRKAVLPDGMVNIIEVSAKEKTGLSDIEEKVYDMLLGKDFEEDSVMITNQRHKEACVKADSELMMAINALEAGITADIAYVYLENAASYLGEVTGMTVSDEVIGEVFSKFCIGK